MKKIGLSVVLCLASSACVTAYQGYSEIPSGTPKAVTGTDDRSELMNICREMREELRGTVLFYDVRRNFWFGGGVSAAVLAAFSTTAMTIYPYAVSADEQAKIPFTPVYLGAASAGLAVASAGMFTVSSTLYPVDDAQYQSVNEDIKNIDRTYYRLQAGVDPLEADMNPCVGNVPRPSVTREDLRAQADSILNRIKTSSSDALAAARGSANSPPGVADVGAVLRKWDALEQRAQQRLAKLRYEVGIRDFDAAAAANLATAVAEASNLDTLLKDVPKEFFQKAQSGDATALVAYVSKTDEAVNKQVAKIDWTLLGGEGMLSSVKFVDLQGLSKAQPVLSVTFANATTDLTDDKDPQVRQVKAAILRCAEITADVDQSLTKLVTSGTLTPAANAVLPKATATAGKANTINLKVTEDCK